MDWYTPITILPALGLLVLSTSNFIVSLNNEIAQMKDADPQYQRIVILKLKQLKRLGIANTFLYGSILLFLVAGLSNAFVPHPGFAKTLMVVGVMATAVALVFLFVHALKAVAIRQEHFRL